MSYRQMAAKNKAALRMLKAGLPLTLKGKKSNPKTSSRVGRYIGPFTGQ